MTFELFRGKEKKQKHRKNAEKKHKQLLLKNRKLNQNQIKRPMNFSWEIKKQVFFSRLAGKNKKRDFSDLNE